jgi:mRNA interferase MazF
MLSRTSLLLNRGDLLTVAIPGDYGKPRPAVVVQSDFASEFDSVVVCLITSDIGVRWSSRVAIPANERTGLRHASQIMTEKVFAAIRAKCGPVFGRLDETELAELGDALIFIIGLADA